MKARRFVAAAVSVLATLSVGCSAEQMARIEKNMEQLRENTEARQHACASEADRYWNLNPGTATTSGEKFIGSGMYEVKVSGYGRNGVCTVTEVGGIRGIVNESPSNASGAAGLQDLVGAKGSSGESELESRGYSFVKNDKAGNSSYSAWRRGDQCVWVRTADGRYTSIVDATMADCR